MFQDLFGRLRRAGAEAAAAAEKALCCVLDYGLVGLLLTCLAAGLGWLVWAHWAVD
jgi:hypothetical protein